MIITGLSAYNFAGYSSIHINLDRHATYLIGRNGSGKTILGLDIIWFVMQGIAEKSMNGTNPLIGERYRFIGPDGKSAMAEIVLFDEINKHEIRVIRKLTKSGTELSFSGPAGMELDQDWLNSLFNVFFISPKKFIELSPKNQAIQLGIDTSEYDLKIAELKEKFTEINKDLKKYLNLAVVEKVDEIDTKELQEQMEAARLEVVNKHKENQAVNKATREAWEQEKKDIDAFVKNFNEHQRRARVSVDNIEQALEVLLQEGYAGEEIRLFIEQKIDKFLPDIYAENFYPDEPTNMEFQADDYVPAPGEKVYVRELPDQNRISELQEKMLTMAETNRKAALYTEYIGKLEDKAAKEKELLDNKTAQETEEAKKTEYIKAFNLPFSKLSIDDDGGLLLNGKPLKPQYHSSGELIRTVPALLSSLHPEFKYIFLQEFDLLDEETQVAVEKELTEKGFQLVIEMVGKEKLPDKNCILLRNNTQVDKYPEPKQKTDFRTLMVNEAYDNTAISQSTT